MCIINKQNNYFKYYKFNKKYDHEKINFSFYNGAYCKYGNGTKQ